MEGSSDSANVTEKQLPCFFLVFSDFSWVLPGPERRQTKCVQRALMLRRYDNEFQIDTGSGPVTIWHQVILHFQGLPDKWPLWLQVLQLGLLVGKSQDSWGLANSVVYYVTQV